MAWWHRSFCVGWISLQCMLLVSVDTLFCAAKRETHYDVLGVRKSASEQDIKKAFRRAALENHPDKKPEGPERDAATEEFQRISASYEVIGDEYQRRKYDTELNYGSEQEFHHARGRGGRTFMFTQNGRTFMFSDEDFFDQFTRQQRRRQEQHYYRDQNLRGLQDLAWPVVTQICIFAAIWWTVRAVMFAAEDTDGTANKPKQRDSHASTSFSTRTTSSSQKYRPSINPDVVAVREAAATHARHIAPFDERYLRQRAKRCVICFPKDGKNALEWQLLEQIALQFRTDPLSFCWVDLKFEPKWASFLEKEYGAITGRPLFITVGSSGTKAAAFFPSANQGGTATPISPVREEAERWLLRIVEGTETLRILDGELPR